MKIIATIPPLIIREYSAADLPLWMGLSIDDDVQQYLPPRTADENRQVFEQNLTRYSDGSGLARWGIFDAATGEYAGNCMLVGARPGLSGIEAGYALCKNFWGRGLATQVTCALVNYGFNILNIDKICAITHPMNIPSQKVLKKAGFKEMGTVFLFELNMPYFEITKDDQ